MSAVKEAGHPADLRRYCDVPVGSGALPTICPEPDPDGVELYKDRKELMG